MIPEEPAQTTSREVRVEYPAEPVLMMAYHKPAYPNIDDAYFTLLHGLLSDGRSSVLTKELVLERKLATSISTTEAPGSRYPSLFIVSARPAPKVSVAHLRDEIQKLLERYTTKLFTNKGAWRKRSVESGDR